MLKEILAKNNVSIPARQRFLRQAVRIKDGVSDRSDRSTMANVNSEAQIEILVAESVHNTTKPVRVIVRHLHCRSSSPARKTIGFNEYLSLVISYEPTRVDLAKGFAFFDHEATQKIACDIQGFPLVMDLLHQ